MTGPEDAPLLPPVGFVVISLIGRLLVLSTFLETSLAYPQRLVV